MDAPHCQKIPPCGRRHYGACAPGAKAEPARDTHPAGPEKKFVAVAGVGSSGDRISSLEVIVEELVERVDRMDRRREYQKNLMRERRSK